LENYCCMENTLAGGDILEQGKRQAEKFGAHFFEHDVLDISREEDQRFVIAMETGEKLAAWSLILAMGISRNRLNVPGEKEFLGKGVSYCVDCDGHFFRDEVVVVVGDGSAACSGALNLLLVAREVHARSARASGPFVEVNCAAIPETLIESELFGHEKGAFTNALQRRRGKVETADHGTLFLDEIADMSLNTQAKVLRVLQEMRFERVGGEESVSVDVRVIAATNKDIRAEIGRGRFREDLFFRINVVPIAVPPLRERLEDMPLLAAYFMEKFKRPSAQEPRIISPEGMTALCSYHWPGNIRELKNFVERVNIMTEEAVITAASVKAYLGAAAPAEPNSALSAYGGMTLAEARDSFEREMIADRLRENGGNISRAAEALGVYASNLHSKMKKLNMTTEK